MIWLTLIHSDLNAGLGEPTYMELRQEYLILILFLIIFNINRNIKKKCPNFTLTISHICNCRSQKAKAKHLFLFNLSPNQIKSPCFAAFAALFIIINCYFWSCDTIENATFITISYLRLVEKTTLIQ